MNIQKIKGLFEIKNTVEEMIKEALGKIEEIGRAEKWQEDGKSDRKDEKIRGLGGPTSKSCFLFSRK